MPSAQRFTFLVGTVLGTEVLGCCVGCSVICQHGHHQLSGQSLYSHSHSHSTSTVTVQSQYSHSTVTSTVTAQSLYSLCTVTVQSHCTGTVTVQSHCTVTLYSHTVHSHCTVAVQSLPSHTLWSLYNYCSHKAMAVAATARSQCSHCAVTVRSWYGRCAKAVAATGQ